MSTTRSPMWKKLDFETQRSVFSTSKGEINWNATERVLRAFPRLSWIFTLAPVQRVRRHTLHTVAILGFLLWLSSKTMGTTRSALWKFLDSEVGLVLKT